MIHVKVVHMNGRDYFCTVLPYVPPTPMQAFELSWPTTTRASVRPKEQYIDPWDYVNTKLDKA